MKLSKEAVAEFQEIYLKEFGKKLKQSEAERKAGKFLHLMKIIANN